MPETFFGLHLAHEIVLETSDFTLLRLPARVSRSSVATERLYKINRASNSASMLAREYALLRDAALPCLPKVMGIEEFRGELALLMEMPKSLESGFRTLRDVLERQRKSSPKQRAEKPFNIRQILDLMCICAAQVEGLHNAGILHLALKPEHILCSVRATEAASNLDADDISFLHFAHALQKKSDTQNPRNSISGNSISGNSISGNSISGNSTGNTALGNTALGNTALGNTALGNSTSEDDARTLDVQTIDGRYIAPEQTGRVALEEDERTDLYALGCVFYELLVGKAPFEAGSEYPDALSMFHAHVAVEPIPPHLVSGSVPEELSRLVLKLLRKSPEERYQSAEGLRRELEECTQRWRKQASLQGFVVGSQDRSDTFRIAKNLIGREEECALLWEVFAQATSGKPRLFLLGGYAGAGKTALVQEFKKRIAQGATPQSNAIFLSGKFDQVRQNSPYSALLQCMEDFAAKIVSESASDVAAWKARIIGAVGNNGRVLTAAFPALERILGEQPPLQELGTQESQNRFRLVVERFLDVLARQEHPLVIFLDDMQWADAGTLALLAHSLKAVEDVSLLMICAYRSNEVDERHPFMQTASQLESAAIPLIRKELGALKEENVRTIVAEALASTPHEIKGLSHLVYEKTDGNPLFVVQLLQSLYRAGSVWFDRPSFLWKWRNDAVSSIHFADNIVELLSGRLRELPEPLQRILQQAACMGNRFEVGIVSVVSEASPQLVSEALWAAQQAGLIQPLGDEKNSEAKQFSFVHDRVQQAAYSMIPEAERSVVHLHIARLLQKKLSIEEREEQIFDLVGHYNKASRLLHDDNERENVALLNLAAARKAKQNAVFTAAAEYIKVLHKLLNDSYWKTHYAMMREASILAAEVGYATENSELLEFHSNALMQNGRTLIDRVQGEKVRIEAYSAQGRYAEAVAVGKRILAMFGVELPHNPSKLVAALYLLRLRKSIGRLHRYPTAGQGTIPPDEKQEIMSILSRFTVPAITSAQNLLPAIVYFACETSLQYGLVATSGYFFFIAGIILRSLFSDNILADRCLQAGSYYAQRYGEDVDVLRGQVSFAATTGYWYALPMDNMRRIVEWERTLFALGVEEEATYCSLHYSAEGLQSTLPLAELASSIREKITMLHKKRIEISTFAAELWYQVVMRLREPDPHWEEFSTINGEFFFESERFRICKEKNNALILGYSFCQKLFLAVLAHQYSKALEFHKEFTQFKDTGTVSSLYHWQHLYLGLAYSSLVQQGEKRHWRQFKRVLKTLKKWASWSKMFHHRYQCLQAEALMHASLQKPVNTDEAEMWFQKSIASAQGYGFLGDEALISERAGMWLNYFGNTAKARKYLRSAYSLYGRWGASALQAMMHDNYPEYVGDMPQDSLQAFPLQAFEGVASATSQAFDMVAVMKSSQAIAGEIALERLLEKMLRVVAESSGAQRVVLLTQKTTRNLQELSVEAELKASGDVVLWNSFAFADFESLPKSIIERTAHQREPLILRHASAEGVYMNNSYLSAHRVKSVLSLPIVNQGKLIGILYAENNLIEGAFTSDRVQILTMLSSQMAVSIENALLVESMTKMERLKKEMEMAAEVQLQMLPKEFPTIPGYETAAFLSMAKEAGGDFYDVLPLGNARYLLVIGDVSGKGMPAALFMSAMVNTVRTQVKYLALAQTGDLNSREISPKSILEIANAMARQSMTRRNFVTMMVAVLDAERHTLKFSSAGHDPAMKWNPSERALEQLRTEGLACNFASEEVFAAKTSEITVPIERGAMVFWNTDGITEAKNERAEEFRNERYWSAIMDVEPATGAEAALSGIIEQVRTFQGTKAQYDDMTLLAIKRVR